MLTGACYQIHLNLWKPTRRISSKSFCDRQNLHAYQSEQAVEGQGLGIFHAMCDARFRISCWPVVIALR